MFRLWLVLAADADATLHDTAVAFDGALSALEAEGWCEVKDARRLGRDVAVVEMALEGETAEEIR